MDDLLLEAHEPSALLGKITSLHQGEMCRLKGGVAVKRLATEDGRDGFKVAASSSWRSGDPYFEGDLHRTPEDAAREAFRKSARSTDPESIGGTTPINSYAPYVDGGSEVRIRDWTTDGRAIVAAPGAPATERVVDPAKLVRRSPAMYESDARLLEVGLNHEKTIGSKGKGLFGIPHAQLPAPIQHVYNDLVESGKHTAGGPTYRLAIGIVRNWSQGKGAKDPKVIASARAAMTEWEKLKAEAHARSGAKKLSEAVDEVPAWTAEEVKASVQATLGAAVPPFPVREGEAFWLPPLREEYSEASRAAALAKRKANHPDWNWGGLGSSHKGGDVLRDVAGGHHKVVMKDAKGIYTQRIRTAPGQLHHEPSSSTFKETHFTPHHAVGKKFDAKAVKKEQPLPAGAAHAKAKDVPLGHTIKYKVDAKSPEIDAQRVAAPGSLPAFKSKVTGHVFQVHPDLEVVHRADTPAEGPKVGDKVTVHHPGNSSVAPHSMPGVVKKVTPSAIHVADASGYKGQKAHRIPRTAFKGDRAVVSSRHRGFKD